MNSFPGYNLYLLLTTGGCMSVNVSFHNVDHSEALVDFIKSKADKLQKFLKPSEKVKCLIEHDSKGFKSRLNISLIHKNISLSSKADDAFKAVNEVFAKAKRKAVQHHEQLGQKLH